MPGICKLQRLISACEKAMELPVDEEGDVRMDVGLIRVDTSLKGFTSAEYFGKDYFIIVQSAKTFYRWSVRKYGKPFTPAEEKMLACPAIVRDSPNEATYTIG